MPKAPIAERVEVAGVRPATFKLVPKSGNSFDVYYSRRKIGTAEQLKKNAWTATFSVPGARFRATAESAPYLLRLIGEYVLTLAARREADRPVEETHPELKVKGRKTAEEQLSVAFVQKAQQSWRRQLERQLEELRKRFERVPKGER